MAVTSPGGRHASDSSITIGSRKISSGEQDASAGARRNQQHRIGASSINQLLLVFSFSGRPVGHILVFRPPWWSLFCFEAVQTVIFCFEAVLMVIFWFSGPLIGHILVFRPSCWSYFGFEAVLAIIFWFSGRPVVIFCFSGRLDGYSFVSRRS